MSLKGYVSRVRGKRPKDPTRLRSKDEMGARVESLYIMVRAAEKLRVEKID